MADPAELHPGMAELLRDAFGAQAAMVLYAAVKLELAEHLAAGPKTIDQLSQAVGADRQALLRLLRGLVSQGICEEPLDSQFRLTGLGDSLRHDHPNSVRARILLNVEVHHALWACLLDTITTAESASVRVHGLPFYEYLAKDRRAGEVFDQAMSSAGWARHRFRAAIEAYDFGRFRTIVDVGGGNGAFLTEILTCVRGPSGIVFDVSRLEASANEVLRSGGVADRCCFVAGDAFTVVPGGADAYVLSNFLNSWGDVEAAAILRRCHEAMSAAATLLVIDWVMPGAEKPGTPQKSRDATTMDLVMLSAFGARSGRIRTFGEFQTLLAGSGFEIAARLPTRASVEVIVACKAPAVAIRTSPLAR